MTPSVAERADAIVLGMGVGGEEVAECLAQKLTLGLWHRPTDDLHHLIYAYPTFYRGFGEAVRQLAPDVHTPSP